MSERKQQIIDDVSRKIYFAQSRKKDY